MIQSLKTFNNWNRPNKQYEVKHEKVSLDVFLQFLLINSLALDYHGNPKHWADLSQRSY